MFVPHRVDVGKYLEPTNSLKIIFESAYNKGEAIRKERGDLVCWNGHYSRVYVRKAQYHYGWDWGPSLVTCGPWKPISLERYQCQITDIRLDVSLSEDLKSANVAVDLEIDANSTGHIVQTLLIGPAGDLISTTQLNGASGIIDIPKPMLWYPFTHGDQPLYKIQAKVTSSSGLR